jgi:Dolichyl-phosphate-mannose-protein mannosyltransferase
MLYLSRFFDYCFNHLWQRIERRCKAACRQTSPVFPYLSLLLWILPLLLFTSGNNSLMAHDEGLYAWRSRRMFESGDWINPWSEPHHKTPGPYWLIASFYTLFGISEFSGRLSSIIAGIFSFLLIYEIGKILLNKKVAWLAVAILSVEFLWLQYCRLGTPDVPMIFLVLLGIWSLLKAELSPQNRFFHIFIAGLSFGLGFLVRSFMIFLPIVALLPYLIWENRRHKHLSNPILYLGFVVGLIPTLTWIWLNSQRYGNDSLTEIFKFVFRLGSNERGGNGIIFYFWNLPALAFPWFFLSLIGLILTIHRPIPRYQLILVGFPVVLFAELSLFSTRLPHYSLSLYPFIALLAAVGLNWLGNIFNKWGGRQKYSPHDNMEKFLRNISYAFTVLAVLFLLATIVILTLGNAEIYKYATLALAFGLGLLILPLVSIARYLFGKKFITARYWIAGWLIPAWLVLAVAGSNGFLGDYNPDMRTFLAQKAIASILQTHPINFVQVGDKTGVLLNFYTPHHGKRVDNISQLPGDSYAWISAKQAAESSTPHRVIGTVQKYQLIQVLN